MKTVNSKVVAELINKRHDNFMRDIRKYIASLGDSSDEYFLEGSYTDAIKKSRFCYELTLKGCELISNRIPLDRGAQFKREYTKLFGETTKEDIKESKTEYTVEEVAQILGCSERSVYRNIQSGKLEAVEKEILIPQVKKLIPVKSLENYKRERGIE